jgi:CHAD domain-containing protein
MLRSDSCNNGKFEYHVMVTETRQFAGEQAARLLRHLAFQISRTLKSSSADAVHDVRVAIRRFTQTIAVCKPCFPGKDTRKIRRRLKKIMALAGEVRNCDVALKFIAKSRLADAVQLQSNLQRHRKAASRILVSELKRWKDRHMSLKWRAALEGALARNQDAFAGTAIEVTSRRTLRRMVKDFLEYGNEAASAKASPEDLHRFRIVAKKFRYTLELFEPLYGSSLNREVAKIKRAQTLLGDINDCVTVASMVAQYNGGNRLAARLRKRERKKTEEFRRYWTEDFQHGEQLRSWCNRLARPPARPRGIKKPVASSGLDPASSPRKSAAVA